MNFSPKRFHSKISMVRVASSLYVYLPEPTQWPRTEGGPPNENPAWARTEVCEGPVRALVVLEVKEFSFFHLGVTHVVDIDPHGALARARGFEAVEKLRLGLRQPAKYPTLGDACGHVLQLIYGQAILHTHAFEALITPVDGSDPPWDASLLGAHSNRHMWHGMNQLSAFSPELACCTIETCRDPFTKGTRVPLMLLQPFVPRDLDSVSATRTLTAMVHEGRHRPSHSKRHRLEDGEIDESSTRGGSSSVSTQKGQNGVSKKLKSRLATAQMRMTAPGRLVFIMAHYVEVHATGTTAHVHEVTDEDWETRPGDQRASRVLTLRALPSGDERSVPSSMVVPLDRRPSFADAWAATLLSGDEARKHSLLLGCAKHADGFGGFQTREGVFRRLVPGTAPAEAKRFAAAMEAVTGRQQPNDGGKASRSADESQSSQGDFQ